MTGLLLAPLSLATSEVLILCCYIHLHNQRKILSLMMLMMSRPITYILILRLYHRHILHLQIILKREIYLERELKLSPSKNTSEKNGLNQFGNESTMGK